ncbi:MAG: hypothetical protein LBM38_02500 [Clostridiales bacterium]|nr:hypothetical protein [Clostridiales bacterium]
MNLRMFFVLSVLAVALLVCTGYYINKMVVDIKAKTVANSAEFERLNSLDKTTLEENLKFFNYKSTTMQNAMPDTILQERILVDLYRAQAAVPGFDGKSLSVSFGAKSASSGVKASAASGSTGSAGAAGSTDADSKSSSDEDSISTTESTMAAIEMASEANVESEAVATSGAAATSASTNGQQLEQVVTLGFNATYENVKNFVLELDKTPRTMEVVSITTTGDNDKLNCSIVLNVYGLKANMDEKDLIEEYAIPWFSPFKKGTTDLFKMNEYMGDDAMDNKLFNGKSAPSTFYKDFMLYLNDGNPNYPEVVMEKYQDYDNMVGGNAHVVDLYLSYDNGNYTYKFVYDGKNFPEKQGVLQTYKNKNITINIVDDAPRELLSTMPDTDLNIYNGTDKKITVSGNYSKRTHINDVYSKGIVYER